MGICAHHVLHIALRHAQRGRALTDRLGGAFDLGLYNLAADAIVNSALMAAGYVLPRPCPTLPELLARAFHEDASAADALARYDAEALYLRLTEGGGAGRGGGTGKRDEDTAGAGLRGDAARPEDAARAYADGIGFAADLSVGNAEGEAGDASAPAAEWRQRLARALRDGRLAGRGIGTLGHRLADLPQSRQPWERILRGLAARAVMPVREQTHARPAARWIALDAAARAAGRPAPPFEPGPARQRPRPRIVVGLDASGSVAPPLLARFAAEIAAIGRRSGAELHLLIFDEVVHAHLRPAPGALAATLRDTPLPRDGGTDFAPLFAAAAALSPSILIVLTDLQAPTGGLRLQAPILWAVTPDATAPPIVPPKTGVLLHLDR